MTNAMVTAVKVMLPALTYRGGVAIYPEKVVEASRKMNRSYKVYS